MMQNKELLDLSSSSWREKVYIETSEHIITGYVYMPSIGKKSRILTEILNTGRTFIAVKECTLEYKLSATREIEKHDFLQVNLSSVLIMRPMNA